MFMFSNSVFKVFLISIWICSCCVKGKEEPIYAYHSSVKEIKNNIHNSKAIVSELKQ